jgi:hypothetical protein
VRCLGHWGPGRRSRHAAQPCAVISCESVLALFKDTYLCCFCIKCMLRHGGGKATESEVPAPRSLPLYGAVLERVSERARKGRRRRASSEVEDPVDRPCSPPAIASCCVPWRFDTAGHRGKRSGPQSPPQQPPRAPHHRLALPAGTIAPRLPSRCHRSSLSTWPPHCRRKFVRNIVRIERFSENGKRTVQLFRLGKKSWMYAHPKVDFTACQVMGA